MIKEVKLNTSNDNPFYGLRGCLKLQQAASLTINESLLEAAYAEVKDNTEKKKMFFSLLFSVGDITNRQHNIFKKKKVDGGGFSNRESFEVILKWLYKKDKKQFEKFLTAGLFNEFSCFDLLFKSRVQTVKNSSRVVEVSSVFLDEVYSKMVLDYTYSVINGTNPFNKMLVAKFLTIPRTSKRQGHKQMLPETVKIMKAKAAFLNQLSEMMGWDSAYFKGYREWRQQYNGELESVLFTTGKINEFTKDEFLNWFDKLPAQARFRVKNRILYSMCTLPLPDGKECSTQNPKWAKFQPWLKEWEQFKENKQKEQRILEEKVRQGQASDEDKQKLKEVKKEAKVTVGATNFTTLYDDILVGRIDKLKLESFMNKVNLPYNSLVIIDDSGSMSGAPFNFATFIAATCLIKNPDDDGRNLLGFFSDTGRWFSYINAQGRSKNSILRTQVASTKVTPFVDPEKSFYENYIAIDRFCRATFRGGWTDLRTILKELVRDVQTNPELLDAIRNYPVWTIVSDGELNSCASPEASLNDFFREAEKLLGFRPYLIMMDICSRANASYLKADRFAGIDNVIYIPANPAMIEQVLTNFNDMDIFDVYTPLLSLYRSNRYELVRANTL